MAPKPPRTEQIQIYLTRDGASRLYAWLSSIDISAATAEETDDLTAFRAYLAHRGAKRWGASWWSSVWRP